MGGGGGAVTVARAQVCYAETVLLGAGDCTGRYYSEGTFFFPPEYKKVDHNIEWTELRR